MFFILFDFSNKHPILSLSLPILEPLRELSIFELWKPDEIQWPIMGYWTKCRGRGIDYFGTKKFVLKSYWKNSKCKVWNALVEKKSRVRVLFKAHKITLIFDDRESPRPQNSLCLIFKPGDAELIHQMNMIWWALDRARTLDFSSTNAFQTLACRFSQ